MADPAVEKHEELRQAPDAPEPHQQEEEEADEEEEDEEEEEEDDAKVKEVEDNGTDGSIAPPSLGLNSDEFATPDKVAPAQELLAAPQGWHKKVGHHFHCNLLLLLHHLIFHILMMIYLPFSYEFSARVSSVSLPIHIIQLIPGEVL